MDTNFQDERSPILMSSQVTKEHKNEEQEETNKCDGKVGGESKAREELSSSRKIIENNDARRCTSVVIEIEDAETTVIPASDSSGSETEYEEGRSSLDIRDNDAKEDDANNEVVEDTTGAAVVDESIIDESSSSKEDDDDDGSDEYGPSGEELEEEQEESASQIAQGELMEAVECIEQRNKGELENLKRLSPQDRIFPDVRLSTFHTVAITLTDDYKPGDALIPYPINFVSKWHKDYVPMPCCSENQRTLKKRVNLSDQSELAESDQKVTFQDTTVKLWDKITASLTAPFQTCDDIARAVKSYCKFSGTFTVLEYTLDVLMSSTEREKFFSTVLPGMVNLCISLPQVLTCPIPFLVRFMNHSITMSQKQIACLLANAFFCTFPKRFAYEDDFPSINFLSLLTGCTDDDRLTSRANKLRCILHYFERIVDEMPKGVVTYTRKAIRTSKTPDWSQSAKRICPFITLHEGTIETDGERLLQVDFANQYVGGGVIGHGCVQEEILFVIYPELLVSRLFTERLASCEALVITGCERFSNYRGYASGFEFAGDFVDCSPWNSRGRKCTQIVAIDALYITKHNEQFHPQKLLREVNKAYIGFSNPMGTSGNLVAVATGKWGCGAFRGDAHLKTVLQILAASQAGRSLVLFTFGDLRLQKEAEEIYAAIKNKSIKEVWTLLNQYNKLFCSYKHPQKNLFEFLTQYQVLCPPLSSADNIGVGRTEKQIPAVSSKSPVSGNKSSPRRSGMNLKQFILSPKRLSERGDVSEASGQNNSDWLHKLNESKSGWGSAKISSEKIDESPKKLTDDEICALLDVEDEPMDIDDTCANERATSSSITTAVEQTPDATIQSLMMTPKRSKTITCDPATKNAPCDVPKQKRQMTLEDFYKPLKS